LLSASFARTEVITLRYEVNAMPIKTLACHDMDEFSSTGGTAWLKWDADSNHLVLSKAAVQLLRLDKADIATDQIGLEQLFDKRSINKLAIAIEDTLNSRAPQAIDLPRNSTEGAQLLRLHIRAAPSQHQRIILAKLEDLGANSESQHQISASMHFARFVSMIGKDLSFFESVPLGLVMIQDGFITQVNAKASEILGSTVKGLLGEPVSRILSSKQSYDTYMEAMWGEEIEDEQNSVDVEY
jgi:PAS domain-containing protein